MGKSPLAQIRKRKFCFVC